MVDKCLLFRTLCSSSPSFQNCFLNTRQEHIRGAGTKVCSQSTQELRHFSDFLFLVCSSPVGLLRRQIPFSSSTWQIQTMEALNNTNNSNLYSNGEVSPAKWSKAALLKASWKHFGRQWQSLRKFMKSPVRGVHVDV